MAFADGDHLFGEAALAQLHGRHVDRHALEHQPRGMPGGRLAAGLVQYPLADARDLAAFLRHRDELGRAAGPELRACPAQQGLDRRRPGRVDIDQRLVDQLELLAFERAVQRVLDLQAPLDAGQHVLAVVLVRVAPGFLGRVHGSVGRAQKGVEIAMAVVGQRDADTRPHLQGGVAAVQRRGQRSDQLARDMAGIGRVGEVAQHHHELVAVEAAEQVGVAQVLVQPRRGGLEQHVAGGVAEGVVDRLETVQVDEQHRQDLAVAARFGQGVLGLFAQQDAVGQPGQQVVMG